MIFERAWGNASKVYTAERTSYNRIVDSQDPHKFSRMVDAFHASAALGLRLNLSSPQEGRQKDELLNVYSIDPEQIFWALLSAMNMEASGAQRFEILMAYADSGVRKIAEEFEIYGDVQAALDAILGEK